MGKDINKYFLGKLCKRGHDHEGTGQSLRIKRDGCCYECAKMMSNRLRPTRRGKYPRQLFPTKCEWCGKECFKRKDQLKSYEHHFCDRKCSFHYKKKHLKMKCVRSKLEKWIEEQLIIIYPKLEILFNKNDIIGSELDIYIPSLKLAFELNGLFHYEPIWGDNRLDSIKNNDKRKFQACSEKYIGLCVIDTSKQRYVTPKTSQQYLDIITNIINERLVC